MTLETCGIDHKKRNDAKSSSKGLLSYLMVEIQIEIETNHEKNISFFLSTLPSSEINCFAIVE